MFTCIGNIELNITKGQAQQGYHSGSCDLDIAQLRRLPRIRQQLNRIDKEELISALKEYGGWSKEELQDHDTNLSRLLWLACGDICDQVGMRD